MDVLSRLNSFDMGHVLPWAKAVASSRSSVGPIWADNLSLDPSGRLVFFGDGALYLRGPLKDALNERLTEARVIGIVFEVEEKGVIGKITRAFDRANLAKLPYPEARCCIL